MAGAALGFNFYAMFLGGRGARVLGAGPTGTRDEPSRDRDVAARTARLGRKRKAIHIMYVVLYLYDKTHFVSEGPT